MFDLRERPLTGSLPLSDDFGLYPERLSRPCEPAAPFAAENSSPAPGNRLSPTLGEIFSFRPADSSLGMEPLRHPYFLNFIKEQASEMKPLCSCFFFHKVLDFIPH